jgi:hypothetical protein
VTAAPLPWADTAARRGREVAGGASFGLQRLLTCKRSGRLLPPLGLATVPLRDMAPPQVTLARRSRALVRLRRDRVRRAGDRDLAADADR